MLKAKSVTHQGQVRGNNEDAVLENDSLGLWIVADGVGGNTHGDVASQLACQAIERRVRQGESISEAILHANEAILQAIDENAAFQSMATTVVACHFHSGHFELAWVGDSRAYLIDNTGICQISRDHNVANELFEAGEIDDAEVGTHPGQHELTQALGQPQAPLVSRSLGELHDGDCLLLCTDGLSGVLDDQQILRTIRKHPVLEAACKDLLDQVLGAGAPDNVSFSLIRYQSDEPKLKASDFKEKSYRAPFDRSTYHLHSKNRPLLLGIIFISILILLLFI